MIEVLFLVINWHSVCRFSFSLQKSGERSRLNFKGRGGGGEIPSVASKGRKKIECEAKNPHLYAI
jgi:hypothetical protein